MYSIVNPNILSWPIIFHFFNYFIALTMAETLTTLVVPLDKWLSNKMEEVSANGLLHTSDINMVPFLKQSVQEMMEHREGYEEVRG